MHRLTFATPCVSRLQTLLPLPFRCRMRCTTTAGTAQTQLYPSPLPINAAAGQLYLQDGRCTQLHHCSWCRRPASIPVLPRPHHFPGGEGGSQIAVCECLQPMVPLCLRCASAVRAHPSACKSHWGGIRAKAVLCLQPYVRTCDSLCPQTLCRKLLWTQLMHRLVTLPLLSWVISPVPLQPCCRPSAASFCGRSSCCGRRTCPAAGAPRCAALCCRLSSLLSPC